MEWLSNFLSQLLVLIRKSLIICAGLFFLGNNVSGQWTSNGFVIQDPAGPTPAGFTESGNCVTTVGTGNPVGRLYNNANVDLTSASSGFSYTFDLNFGTNTSIGDGFSFVIMGNIAYGADGGRLGYTNMTADYIAFEWDSFVNDATTLDEGGVPTQHMGISAYNGAATELANEVSMGAEVRTGSSYTATISWVPDGSGGGTFTQTIVNGSTITLTATLSAAQLAAYDFATSADFSFHAVTNSVTAQTQSACFGNPVAPVKLGTFMGKASQDKVDLTWTTVQELNNKEFIILRSFDAARWTIIGNIEGANSSSSVLKYSFSDPISMSGSKIYYKLKQIDYDGKEEIFPVIAVALEGENKMYLVPNPTKGHFKLVFSQGISPEDFGFNIYDIKGKEVFPESIDAFTGNILVNGSNLPEGIYYLRSYNGVSYNAEKFIIEN